MASEHQEDGRRQEGCGPPSRTGVFVGSPIIVKLKRQWHFRCFQINLYSNMVMRKQLLSKR